MFLISSGTLFLIWKFEFEFGRCKVNKCLDIIDLKIISYHPLNGNLVEGNINIKQVI